MLDLSPLVQLPPEAKPALRQTIFSSARLLSLPYWLEIVFAAGIATLGLELNSPAAVIGAMLISPLMDPIVSSGLALAAGDLYLGLKSAAKLALSIALSILLSATIVWLLPFRTPTSEILARTQPTLLDLGVAILSGLAGSLVLCRSVGGGPLTTLPGVAIAVSLMPPLCTVGFGLGIGLNTAIMGGAALLFLTNLAAIITAAFVVFLAVRLDAVPFVPAEDSAPGAFEPALHAFFRGLTSQGPLASLGRLPARVLLVALILIALFVPLRRSLNQLRDEIFDRSAARDALRSIARPEAVVSQSLDLSGGRVRMRAVLTDKPDPALVAAAEKRLAERTGKPVTLTIRQVVSEEEMADLRLQLAQPPAPESLIDLQTAVLERVQPAIRALWPAATAEFAGYEFVVSPAGPAVLIRYHAAKPMDESVAAVLAQALRSQLGDNRIQVRLESLGPAPKPLAR